jgi:Flp pilus assembly protein TadG
VTTKPGELHSPYSPSTPEAPRARSVMRRCRDERGASTIEMVIIFPVTLFIVFGIVQVGVWYYASSVARAAAQQGAQASAVYDANSGDGTRRRKAALVARAPGQSDPLTLATGEVGDQLVGCGSESEGVQPGVPLQTDLVVGEAA